MDQSKGIDARLLKRIPVNRGVFVQLSDGKLAQGRLRDLSGSGALLEIPLSLTKNQVVELRFDQHDLPFATAMVTRVQTPGLLFGVGWIEFFEDVLPKGVLIKGSL